MFVINTLFLQEYIFKIELKLNFKDDLEKYLQDIEDDIGKISSSNDENYDDDDGKYKMCIIIILIHVNIIIIFSFMFRNK